MTVESAQPQHEVSKEMTTTATDLDDLRVRMQRWLAGRLGADAEVGAMTRPPEAGMSNVSLLFDATWTEDGTQHSAGLVARMAPDTGAVPVFPEYDLRRQFEVMHTVAERSAAPVPRM